MLNVSIQPPGTGKLTFQAERANTFLKRFTGLMGKAHLPPGTGLLLYPCNSIHMMFMRFPIDAIFFDRNYRILKITHSLKPWIGLAGALGAYGVLELPAGSLESLKGLSHNQSLILQIEPYDSYTGEPSSEN